MPGEFARMTGRLPFDPSKLPKRAAAPTGAPPPDRPLTIAELAARIDNALKSGIPTSIKVVGEVSGAVQRTHWYFNAKDDVAVVSCVMFAFAAKRSGISPENGRQYVLSGRVEFYAKGGKVSFIVDRIEPVGEGALDAAFRKLCEELRTLGWFDPARKRPLPAFPRNIAVVTSATGAALQDVLNTMARRCPSVGVIVADVRVQGDRASEEIARAIRAIGRRHAELAVDAILVTRGGGSKEDLWSFNERIVAEAIVHSPIPVVAAIGHETDTSIAELVADERASTPTQAAMRLTPDRVELARQVATARSRLTLAVRRLTRIERERLRSTARHPFFRDPAWILTRARTDLRHARVRLIAGLRERVMDDHRDISRVAHRLQRISPEVRMTSAASSVRSATQRLQAAISTCQRESVLRAEAAARQLESVGPRSVLGRGYSWTLRSDGSLLRSVADVAPGDTLSTQLADGRVDSVVGGSFGSDLRKRLGEAPPKRPPLGRRKAESHTPSLFGPDPIDHRPRS